MMNQHSEVIKKLFHVTTSLFFLPNLALASAEQPPSQFSTELHPGLANGLIALTQRSEDPRLRDRQTGEIVASPADKEAPTRDSLAPNHSDNSLSSDEKNTIVVTGSNIRGADKPIGGQLIAISQEEIRRSGFSSVRDIAELLPQNFGAGVTGELQLNQDSSENIAAGSTFNLRGLGQNATLSLINGRRIPSGGTNASVADISTVPLVAIERVEVLPDGASAVYGSDAVAGVVNIILRRDFEGYETSGRYGFTTKNDNFDEFQASLVSGASWHNGNVLLSYEFHRRDRLDAARRSYTSSLDLRKFGGSDYRIPLGSPGYILPPLGGFFPIYSLPAGQNGQGLTRDDLLPVSFENYYNYLGDLSLFPSKTQHSVFGFFEQDVSPVVQVYVEGHYTNRRNYNINASSILVVSIPKENPYYFDAYGNGDPVTVLYTLEHFHIARNLLGIPFDSGV